MNFFEAVAAIGNNKKVVRAAWSTESGKYRFSSPISGLNLQPSYVAKVEIPKRVAGNDVFDMSWCAFDASGKSLYFFLPDHDDIAASDWKIVE